MKINKTAPSTPMNENWEEARRCAKGATFSISATTTR
jgi:hypothetical protein